MPTRIRLRRGSSVQWAASNTVLSAGEVGVETSDPPRVKVGDGVTGWNALPYILGAQGPQGAQGAQGAQGPAGATGAAGSNGANGANGINGKGILSGTTAPSSGTGVDGDFYIDTEAMVIWGPKTSGAWGVGTALSATSRTPVGSTNNPPPPTTNPQPDGNPWPAPWVTSEDGASGIQDWSNNVLRLVSPASATQSSRATASFAALVWYRFNLKFPAIVDMTTTFSFMGSSDLSNRFDLIFSPNANTVELKRVDANTPVSLSLSQAFTFVANQAIGVSVKCADGQIDIKVWAEGAQEPTLPTLQYSTTLYKSNTYARFACTSGAAATSRTVYLDAFSVQTGIQSLDPTAHIAQSSSQAFTTGTTALDVNFINQTGTLVVASQMLRSNSAALGEAYYNYNINSSNHFVQAKLVIGASGTNVTAGVTARHSTSTNTFYKLSSAAGISNIKLYKVIAGVATELGTYAANMSTNTTRTLRLEVQGNSIRGYLDGTQIIAVIDSSITSGSYGGVSVNPGAAAANASIDDFSVGALTNTPGISNNVLFTQSFDTGSNAASVGFTDMLPGVHSLEQPIVIENGVAQVGNGSFFRNANALCNTDMVSADHWVEADLVIGSSVANQYCGVMARVSKPATGPSYSFYKWECQASSNSVRLETVLNNNVGIFTQVVPYNIQPNTTYKLRLEVIGTNIKGYINNEKILDVTDSTLTTQTGVGFNVGRIDNTLATAWIDNFRAGNFLTGGTGGGGGGGTGISLAEAFTTGTTGTDANFSSIRGTLAISGGQLQAGTTSTEIDAYHTTDLGSANHYVEADFIIGAADTTTYCAINARMATSGLTYYAVETSGDRNQIELIRLVAGTYTSLGTYVTGWTLSSTHRVKLECDGSTINVYTDGTLRISVTDTGITSGTRVGVHMWTTTVSNIKLDNFAAAVIGATQTNETPTVPGVGTGVFLTSGRHIVDPSGYKFIPIGMNGLAAPTGNVPVSGWWSTNLTYMNGRVTTYKNDWKCNFLRINTWYDSLSGWTLQEFIDGVYAVADEYLAQNIVVTYSEQRWTAEDPYVAPTYTTLMAEPYFKALFEGWIARYKTNKYAWLYPLNEPWRADNLSGWAATGTALYNRARELGWTGIFVWGMPDFEKAIDLASTSTIFEDFLSGKTNVVLSWHNYTNGTPAQQSTWAQACNDKGIPVIISECGQSPWSAPDPAMQASLQWTFDNCWIHGFGMVQRGGSGNRGNTATLRALDGAAFYETAYALTDQGTKLMYLGNNKPLPQAIAV